MFDPEHPDMERAVRGERRPSPLTYHVLSALKLARHGSRCSTKGCRHEAHAADGRGRLWCASCFERRRRLVLELR